MGMGRWAEVDRLRAVAIRFRGARFSPLIGVAGLQNICNNIFKLGNLLHNTQKVGRIFLSYCVLANNVIHRGIDAVHV